MTEAAIVIPKVIRDFRASILRRLLWQQALPFQTRMPFLFRDPENIDRYFSTLSIYNEINHLFIPSRS